MKKLLILVVCVGQRGNRIVPSSTALAKQWKVACIALLCLVLVGCATTPAPYIDAQRGGLGYSDFRIASDTFTVSFSGRANATPDMIQKMALLRASELATQNGFTHFVVVESTSGEKTSKLPGSIGFGAFGFSIGLGAPTTSSLSITIKIKCFVDTIPENAIDAKAFIEYNHPDRK